MTKDVDAVFEPKAVIYQAAARVAEARGLPDHWLNNAAKGFLPGEDDEAQPVPQIDGLEVTTASPRYLLAMKLLAMRFGEDDDDIDLLLDLSGITSAADALDLLAQMYPYREPPVKTRLFLEEVCAQRSG
ncbi:MAG: hypothetical protein ACYCO3_03200 [Mycobacteriales bacterium]